MLSPALSKKRAEPAFIGKTIRWYELILPISSKLQM